MFRKSIAGIAAALVLLASCQNSSSSSTSTTATADDGKKVKAGFVYIGPPGDQGWTYAHEVGRKAVADKYSWLETKTVESVKDADVGAAVAQLFDESNMDVVFTTSFGYMDGSVDAAKKYAAKIIEHCSGYKRDTNLGTYFADLYQAYYINGLMAGALTKTNKIGYVGAMNTSEVVRHIDAFALGVKEVNPKATIDVTWLGDWYAPTKAKEAAEAFIAAGVDTLAFTEDTATVVQVAQEKTKAGKQIYTFAHYSPMEDFGPDTVVSGELVNWGIMYDKILSDIHAGTWKSEGLVYKIAEGGAEVGGKFGEVVNPKFEAELKAVKIKDKANANAETTVFDLVNARIAAFKATPVTFDPFTGPIKDQKGKVQIEAGKTADYSYLEQINWFVDNIVGKL